MDWEQIWQSVRGWLTTTGIKILISIILILVSFAIINKICKAIARKERKLEATGKVDKTLYRTIR